MTTVVRGQVTMSPLQSKNAAPDIGSRGHTVRLAASSVHKVLAKLVGIASGDLTARTYSGDIAAN